MQTVAMLKTRPHPGIKNTIAVPAQPAVWALEGSRVALGFPDGLLQVLDLKGKVLFEARSEGDPAWPGDPGARALALRGDLLVAGVGARVEVWDLKTGGLVVVHPGHGDLIREVAVDARGEWVATLDLTSPGIRVAGLRSGQKVLEVGRVRGPAREGKKKGGAALKAVKQALKDFRKVQNRHRGLGAGDTESDQVFQDLVAAAWRGEEVFAENEWALIEDEAGLAQATQDLNKAAGGILKALKAVPAAEREAVHQLLQDELWRADVDASQQDLDCRQVAFLPDRRLVVAHAATVTLWDVEKRQQVKELNGSLQAVVGDALLVQAGEWDAQLLRQPVAKGAAAKVNLQPSWLWADPGSPGEALAQVGDELFRIGAEGKPRRLGAGLFRLGTPLGLSGNTLVSLLPKQTLALTPVASLEDQASREGLTAEALALSPEGQRVLLFRPLQPGHAAPVELWDLETGTIRELPGRPDSTGELGLTQTLAWRDGGSPQVWQLSSGKPFEKSVVQRLVDRRLAILEGEESYLDLATGQIHPLPGKTGEWLSTDPTGKVLVWYSRALQGVSLPDGKPLGKKGCKLPGKDLRGLLPRPDGTVVVLTSKALQLWDLRQGKKRSSVEARLPPVSTPTCWLSDGRLALVLEDGAVGVWAEGQKTLQVLRKATRAQVAPLLPLDGAVLVGVRSGSGSCALEVLDLKGKQLAALPLPDPSFTVATAGKRLAYTTGGQVQVLSL